MTKTLRRIGIMGTISMAAAGAWLACGDDTNGTTPSDAGADTTGSSSGSSSGMRSSSTSSSSSSGGRSSSSGSSSSGGSSNSSSGGSSSGSDAGDAGGIPSNCTDYCTLIQNVCTGQYQQYASTAECMNACKYFGTADAAAGNTLLCHAEHAHNVTALSAPNPHCWHAGPYGWGVCGAQCDDFCNLVTNYCIADAGFGGAPPYASLSDCTNACPMFAEIGDSGMAIVIADAAATSSYSAGGPQSGNTLDCREWHLGNALQSATLQGIHCPHAAAALDGGPCM